MDTHTGTHDNPAHRGLDILHGDGWVRTSTMMRIFQMRDDSKSLPSVM